MNFELRPSQLEAVQAGLDHASKSSQAGIITKPVAGGKSLVIAETVRQAGVKTLILQPSVELLEQNLEKYQRYGDAAVYCASLNKKQVGQVTYATPGSVAKQSEKFKDCGLVLIDECHEYTKNGSQIAKLLKKMNKPSVLGYTATPCVTEPYVGEGNNYYSQLNMLNQTRYPSMFKDMVYVSPIQEMLENRWHTPLRFTCFDVDREKIKFNGADFSMSSASEYLNSNGKIALGAEIIKESLRRGKNKILVFCPTVADCTTLGAMIPGAKIVDSSTDKELRKSIIKDFREGDLQVLINYNILTTGFDVSAIDLIVDMRPTMSYSLYYQMIGRGVRIMDGKAVCDVIDLSGNHKYFGSIYDVDIEYIQGWGYAMLKKGKVFTNVPVGVKVFKKDLHKLNEPFNFGLYNGIPMGQLPPGFIKYNTEKGLLPKESLELIKFLNLSTTH